MKSLAIIPVVTAIVSGATLETVCAQAPPAAQRSVPNGSPSSRPNAQPAVPAQRTAIKTASPGSSGPGRSAILPPEPLAATRGYPALGSPVARLSQYQQGYSNSPDESSFYGEQRAAPMPGPVIVPYAPLSARQYSMIYIDPIPPREIKPFDIITIIVDEKSEVLMNSRFNRQKQSRLKAVLNKFVRFNDGDLATAAPDGLSIDSQLQGTLNTTGVLADQEGIKYRIAATVADVLPNGILRLEARKVIQSSEDDLSEYTLTGELRFEDVNADNTASSENIANLRIVKNQNGRVYDSTKRNWGVRLYDMLSPF